MRHKKHHPESPRKPGLGVAEDAAEYWLLRVERGLAFHCHACGGIRDLGEHGPHGCSPERGSTPTRGESEPMNVQVVFVQRENGPERLVCEAELVFEDPGGVLDGLKLVGFSLWKSPEGEVYATLPSRAFGAGSERRFFDFLRSQDGTAEPVRKLKAFITDAFKEEGRKPAEA
jgi:hypothetical protein